MVSSGVFKLSNVIDFNEYKNKRDNQELDELHDYLKNVFKNITGRSIEDLSIDILKIDNLVNKPKAESLLECIQFLEFAQHNLANVDLYEEAESLDNLIETLYEKLDKGFGTDEDKSSTDS